MLIRLNFIFLLLSGILFSIWSAVGLSQVTISLDEAKKLTVSRHKGIAIGREQVNVAGEQIDALTYTYLPDVGFVLGGNAQTAQSQRESGGMGYAYLKYKIFDRGERESLKMTLVVQKRFLESSARLTERDLSTEVEQLYFSLGIYKSALVELDTLKKRGASLATTAKRMLKLGSANELVTTGIAIASERIELTIETVEEEIADSEMQLDKYIGKENTSSLAFEYPQLDVITRPKPVNTLETQNIATAVRSASEAQTKAESLSSIWMPELTLEGRYGAVPLESRYFDDEVQGSILLVADWSLTSGLQRSKEKSALLREKNLFEREVDFFRESSGVDADFLRAKIKRHESKIESLLKHYRGVSDYSRRIEKEAERGAVAIFEAKSALEELVDLTEKITEEKLSLWMAVVRFNRLVN